MKFVWMILFFSTSVFGSNLPKKTDGLKNFDICKVKLIYSSEVNAEIKALQDKKGCK